MAQTLFDKIWAGHLVKKLDDRRDLLFIDRHLLHEVTSPQAFESLDRAGRAVYQPGLAVATEDHVVSTEPGRSGASFEGGQMMIDVARRNSQRSGIAHFHANHARQGILHVMAPEQGIIAPGMTAVCGDSHTCTLGAMGAVAFGIGTSEVEHVLATQTLVLAKPGNLRVRLEGRLAHGVGAKDVILKLCRLLTVGGGTGYAIEYAGSFVDALEMDGRFTLCNMSIEMGARIGLIAPDEVTCRYLETARYSPLRDHREAALRAWADLATDEGAVFDRQVDLDVSSLGPQITWGTTPDQVVDLDEAIAPDMSDRTRRALDYMGLEPGERLLEKPVDVVFIGSCTNGRIEDLRAAAAVARGHRVDPRVRAYVVPGSQAVKAQAEREGLADVFRQAGFEWREPGCSMCASINREFVPPGRRCVSTTNRNFVGRQGPGARTHLASPAVAAAAAVTGAV
ncbi:MAG TPA: 3-isopropylmalate dehydratase large subunit, partial [Arenibaculum sp.]|nr:3-isopropylmalate dehydratase large subunit [Arenibaculum sp.]